MEFVYLAFLVLAIGFLVGGLARLAVPGPDPMPMWLTIAFGTLGSVVGGVAARILIGGTAGALPFSLLSAVLLVVAYRRVVQRRGITGPEAKKRPTRGIGISSPEDQEGRALDELERLRRAGVLTEEEYRQRRLTIGAQVSRPPDPETPPRG